MVAAWSIGVGLTLAGVDGFAAIDAASAKAGDKGFYFHEACDPWLRVRAQREMRGVHG